MNHTLYELTEAHRRIAEQVEEGVEGAVEALLAVDGDITAKVDNCCRMLASWDAAADGLKAEEARLNARRASLQKAAENLREGIRKTLHAVGKTSVKTQFFTVTVVKAKQRVEILDVKDLPDTFVTVTRVPDKAALKAALANNEVSGARLVLGEESLMVR